MTGARKALVVASDTYDHDGLRSLRSPRADASALAAVLGDPRIGDFEVSVVHNEPSYEVQARVEELFAESRPDDLLLLHFACHGLKSESGELFFATRNTRLGRLASTAVSADFVQRCMRSSRSRSIVLLLDCCYGGAFGTGVAVRAAGPVDVAGSFPTGRLEGGRGRAVITASSAMEYAFEGETLADDHSAPSVFTEALVRGLSTGEADRDADGWVSLNELYEYVFDQVRTSTPGQTPTRDVEMQGELYLARSRRRRVQPAPVPPDLLAASHDPNVFSRLGAVSELRARLLGDNLPAAAGAHARLAEIAELDIRYVADAAAAALREGALGLEPRELAFGRLPQGAPSPRLRVTMAGPPLARTCSVEASSPRIRADEDADGIEVSVDTAAVGAVEGAVTVRSPVGEQVVPVRAEVVPAADPAAVGGEPRPPGDDPVTAQPAAPVTAPATPVTAPVVPVTAPVAPVTAPVTAPVAPAGARTPSVAEADRSSLVAGVLAAVAAGLIAAGALGEFQWGAPVREDDPSWFRHLLVLAGLLAVSAALALWGRTRWTAGAGLLLGVVAASTWNLVTLLTEWGLFYGPEGGVDGGLWLMTAGQLLALLAGAAAVRALRRRPGTVLQPARVPRPLRWSLVAAGVLAGVTVVVSATRPDGSAVHWTIPAWMAVTVTVLPAVVGLMSRRSFRVWLLLGWVVGAGAGIVHYRDMAQDLGAVDDATAATWIGVAVAALLPLAVVLARQPDDDPAPDGHRGAVVEPAAG